MSLPPLRAPREDRAILAIPSFSDVGILVEENRRCFQAAHAPFDEPWHNLRARARREALQVARAYHAEAGEAVADSASESLFLAGHQPELFHPGVWIKNFALHALAKKHGATPLNLVIDTDTSKSAALQVPVRSTKQVDVAPPTGVDDPFAPLPPLGKAGPPLAYLATVPFDAWQHDTPFEERRVVDENLFASFSEHAGELLNGWGFAPMLPEFWTEVRRQSARTPLLGERFAAARRAFERRMGCTNLEAPMSRLCQTESFALFVRNILLNIAGFRATYNHLLNEYREQHGITSRNHPVPDLAVEGDWHEAPFWAWKKGETRRNRLFVRQHADGIDLRAGSAWPRMPIERSAFVAAWRRLQAENCKVRSRALTTTLFARLFLGDLFIHGIGGAKYDELTDALIRHFYGLTPPGYMTLSATLLLPVPRFASAAKVVDQLHALRRRLWYNPERVGQAASLPATAAALIELKQRLVQGRADTKEERRRRYREIREVTHVLRRFVNSAEENAARRLLLAQRELEANAVLGRRDFAFCLYPETHLRELLTRLLNQVH